MKAFKFEFRGLALGGEMVVVAKDEESARAAALDALGGNATHSSAVDSLTLEETLDVKRSEATVVHFWNGDY